VPSVFLFFYRRGFAGFYFFFLPPVLFAVNVITKFLLSINYIKKTLKHQIFGFYPFSLFATRLFIALYI